jgi:hypothetical protein
MIQESLRLAIVFCGLLEASGPGALPPGAFRAVPQDIFEQVRQKKAGKAMARREGGGVPGGAARNA